jgi:hypothetical protein
MLVRVSILGPLASFVVGGGVIVVVRVVVASLSSVVGDRPRQPQCPSPNLRPRSSSSIIVVVAIVVECCHLPLSSGRCHQLKADSGR